MKKYLADIKRSLKAQPLWTVWSLLLCPFYFTFLFLAAATLALINLSIEDGVALFKEGF